MLFEEQISRKPNKYPWTQNFIDAIWQTHWTPNEFSFRADLNQFHTKLTEQEQGVVVRTLSAIGQIEVAVKTFWANLGRNLPHPCMTDLGFVMANNEVIHNQAYEKLLTVLGLEDVFEENLKHPVVKARVDYLRKYMQREFSDDRQQYIYSIILFTLFTEYTSLFSQFYVIQRLYRDRSLLKDTSQQVEYTRNEETLHALVGVNLIQTMREEYPELFDEWLTKRIVEETRVAFAAESAVIDWIMEDYAVEGLSAPILKAYIKGRLNDALTMIGFEEAKLDVSDEEAALLEETKWLDAEIRGAVDVDFFQQRSVNYGKSTQSFGIEDLF